jgi:hypothetical protein
MSEATMFTDDDKNDENFVDDGYSVVTNTVYSTSSTASFSPCTIILSLLRQADPSDDSKVQAQFIGCNLKYNFKAVKTFARPGVSLVH